MDISLDLDTENPVPEIHRYKFTDGWCGWKCSDCRLQIKFQKNMTVNQIEKRIKEHLDTDCPPEPLVCRLESDCPICNKPRTWDRQEEIWVCEDDWKH